MGSARDKGERSLPAGYGGIGRLPALVRLRSRAPCSGPAEGEGASHFPLGTESEEVGVSRLPSATPGFYIHSMCCATERGREAGAGSN